MSGSDLDELLATARAWAQDDPDDQTRGELERLIADPDAREVLEERFAGPLEFGTAGLRGAMGAGPARMNRVVVGRAAAGLAAYVLERRLTGPVVVGYDGRHRSSVFARDVAEVLAGAGVPARLLPRALPTPVLAHAVRELGCAAGVMVTASHNPAVDNGLKIYLEDGAQIVAPEDAAVAAHIAAVGRVGDLPRGRVRLLDEQLVNDYLDTVAGLVEDGPRDLRVVYTAMHGVGADPVALVLETAGFAHPRMVAEQEDPNPDFPTVSFPNPEVPGAMDLALALADKHAADLVVATDPDADRCAVGVPTPGGWRMLRGDEVGALIGGHLLAQGRTGAYATTIVSSRLLGRMVRAAGQEYVETLTGFKWLSRVPRLVFAYEEALGYCVDPEHVRDKDGISALLVVCEIAAAARAEGRTLLDLLDDLAREHGLHATDQVALRLTDAAGATALLATLRSSPPVELAGVGVARVEDLSWPATGLAATDGVRWSLADDSRVVVRPSGTEPLLKCYLEVVMPPGADPAAARIVAAGRLDALRLALDDLLAGAR